MQNNQRTPRNGGVGFAGLLTIAFVVLKLCGVIDWRWWWVISPTWISIALVIIFAILSARANKD